MSNKPVTLSRPIGFNRGEVHDPLLSAYRLGAASRQSLVASWLKMSAYRRPEWIESADPTEVLLWASEMIESGDFRNETPV